MSGEPARFIGVGVGPGDPELMTLKAVRVVRAAPVIAYPQLDETPSMARAIAAMHLNRDQREIVMRVPMRAGRATGAGYDTAAGEIAAALGGGQDVAILCAGDPLVYGSFIAIWERLHARFACEIIPGISSIIAGPARLCRPLLRGDACLGVIPGTLDDAAIERRLAAGGSAVIVKVGRHAGRLRALIARNRLLERAHYIERATLAGERMMPLAAFDQETAPYFSMIVIEGEREEAR
jgi:precorrin-2/cobalt-factor-2 C20-methyltransferase